MQLRLVSRHKAFWRYTKCQQISYPQHTPDELLFSTFACDGRSSWMLQKQYVMSLASKRSSYVSVKHQTLDISSLNYLSLDLPLFLRQMDDIWSAQQHPQTAANRGAEMKTLTEKVKNIGCPGQKWSQCVGLVLDLDVFFLIVLMDWLGGWELATNREKLEARFCLNLLPWGADFAETHWLLNVLQELMSRPSRHPNRFHQFSPSVLPVKTLSTL